MNGYSSPLAPNTLPKLPHHMVTYLLILGHLSGINTIVVGQSDLCFGRRQVEQIICDRPDMSEVIGRESALKQVLESCFAGEFKGRRVHWDCKEPKSGRPAEHRMSYSDCPALIRVSSSSNLSAEDKCAMLVFELCNLQNDEEFQKLATAVVEKKLSRNDFANSCVRLEFTALKKTQSFFSEHPLTIRNSDNSVVYRSLVAFSGSFSDYLLWLDQRDNKAYNARRYFLQIHDKLSSAQRSF